MEHILISVRLKISNIKRAVFYSRRNGGVELKNSKRIKKFISGVLALTMLSLCICQTAVFADDNSELENTIIKVKSLIDVPNELTEFDSNKYSVGNGMEYMLKWELPYINANEDYPEDTCSEINVRVNSYGDIEYYHRYFINTDNRKSLTKLSDKDAENIAKAWLNKIIPDIAGEYEVKDIYSSVSSSDISITFDRMKNDIKYCDNSIRLEIDKKNGEVNSYTLNHLYTNDGAELSERIDENAKREAFLKQNKFEKLYIRKGVLDEAVLIYVPTNPSVVLDSTSGEIPKLTAEEKRRIEENKEFYNSKEETAMEAQLNESGDMSYYAGGGGASADKAALTESEISEIENYSNLISPQDAEKLIRGIENTVIDEYELSSYGYFKQSEEVVPMPIVNDKGEEIAQESTVKDVYYAEFHFAKDSSNKGYFGDATVTINAETGELVNLYSYSYSDNETDKKALDSSVRERNALAFIKKYSVNESEKVKNFDTDNVNSRSFRFNESVNGIKYMDNYINVGVDEYSGKITRFSKNWTNGIRFEQSDNILSEGDAANILFNKIGFNEYYTNIAHVEYAPAIRLVYGLNNGYPYYISATSGKLLDYDGEEKVEVVKNDNLGFTDIDDYFAKDMINELVINGVISVGEDRKFRPNDLITYDEVKKLLSDINYSPWYYRNGSDKSILKEIRRKETLTRLDTIICIVESVDYGKAARLKGVYNCGFNDADSISEEKVGYAAIAKALGIVNGDENGCFNPDDMVTRGEFAVMIYNLLVSEKVE